MKKAFHAKLRLYNQQAMLPHAYKISKRHVIIGRGLKITTS